MSGAQQHRPALGICLIVAGFTVFSGMDALVKHSAQTFAIEHITLIRYAAHLTLLLVFIPFVGIRAVLRGGKLGFLVIRGCFLFLATVLFFGAIASLPLAEAAAISFLAPILTVGLSALILKEPVGIRRWSAVAVGFLGVLIILRPGLQALTMAHLMVLGTAFCFSAFSLMTRHAGNETPVLATLFLTAATGVAGSAALLPFAGTWPVTSGSSWGILVLIGLLALLAEFCLVHAYRCAAESLLAPFQYIQMLWATLLGWAVFNSLPDFWTSIGATLIVGAGLYIWLREVRIRQVTPSEAPASAPM
ncbi:DMT family transporter [Nisaea sp.]|uniref:DMT family transporter n=1 Tax=Nisaea sp. TaxID=2024842 RepID=UPI0032ED122E